VDCFSGLLCQLPGLASSWARRRLEHAVMAEGGLGLLEIGRQADVA